MLVSSYDKLGLDQLRDDSKRILEKDLSEQQVPGWRATEGVVAVLVSAAP